MKQALTNEDIRKLAPAVFSDFPAPYLTDRYSFVNTSSVIDILRNEGFAVVDARQDNPSKRDPRFSRQAITLRAADSLERGAQVGEYVPQILLINSHNGRTQMSFRAGLFRFVCSNGMVIGNTTMQEAIRHTHKLTEQVLERIQRMATMTAAIDKKVSEWQQIELSEAKVQTFAQEAAKIRFGESRAAGYELPALLECRRQEDEGNTLWKVFNRVQENVTMKSLEGKTALGRKVHSSPLRGITENLVVNERLWALADSFATQ